jgi:hypothetical protein
MTNACLERAEVAQGQKGFVYRHSSFVNYLEVTLVPGEKPLTREAFLYLAEEAGLDTSSPHMDELYPYVQSVLVSMQSLNELDVAGAEPDMAFIPPQE